jgi:hypothetical protein
MNPRNLSGCGFKSPLGHLPYYLPKPTNPNYDSMRTICVHEVWNLDLGEGLNKHGLITMYGKWPPMKKYEE